MQKSVFALYIFCCCFLLARLSSEKQFYYSLLSSDSTSLAHIFSFVARKTISNRKKEGKNSKRLYRYSKLKRNAKEKWELFKNCI